MSMLMLMSIPALIVTLMLMHEFTLMRMTMRMPVLMLILMFILMLMAMLMRMHLLMLALMLMSVLMRLVCSDSPDAPYYPFLLLELSAFPSLFPPPCFNPHDSPAVPTYLRNVSPSFPSYAPQPPKQQTFSFDRPLKFQLPDFLIDDISAPAEQDLLKFGISGFPDPSDYRFLGHGIH